MHTFLMIARSIVGWCAYLDSYFTAKILEIAD